MALEAAAQRICWRRAQRHVNACPTNSRKGTVHHRRKLQETVETTVSVGPPQPQGPSPQAKTGRAQDNVQPTAAATNTVNRLAMLMLRNLVVGERPGKEDCPTFLTEGSNGIRFMALPPVGSRRRSESGPLPPPPIRGVARALCPFDQRGTRLRQRAPRRRGPGLAPRRSAAPPPGPPRRAACWLRRGPAGCPAPGPTPRSGGLSREPCSRAPSRPATYPRAGRSRG